MARTKRGGPSTQPRQPGAKACTKCQRMLPLSQYYRAKGVPDGRTSRCKDCVRETRNPEASQAAKQRYRQRKRAAAQRLADALDAPRLEGAACLGKSDLMDPPEPGEDTDRLAQAKAVCRGCPALKQCRAWLNSLPRNKKPSGVVAGRVIQEGQR